ncbi:MAG TPA: hypothetical protein VE567_06435 [Sphingomonas sp.]|nr:hypothetical protein [Sphingomonas sp.]
MSKADLEAKAAEAEAAREKFMSTLHVLQNRLNPNTIIDEVKEKARETRDGAVNAAREGVIQAATHPSTVAAIAVPVLVYFFRKPIARGLGALFGRGKAEPAEPQAQPYESVRASKSSPPEPARPPRAVLPPRP